MVTAVRPSKGEIALKLAAIGMLLLTLVMSSCTNEVPYRVEVAADHLDVPWEMDVAKDGRIFIAERSGQVRVMVDDQLLPEPMINLAEDIHQEAESGLLGLVLDPNFEQNRYVYVYHTYDKNGALYNRVLCLKEQNKVSCM
ncbi:PQQ-dependent sugar dehydrogenase [Paenibacillus terrigena]|uniref:PQQ-dependent sugar dehydrogenase n=1 Tax=Paenibacillus terrigena TaxID=369333 RepID=UPI0028D4EB27|nr:PQQ-dependent sugar dehydrogenase [Paenibacillus terrigena]